MTGEELRAKRESLGLSTSQMAGKLGIGGRFARRLIADYEAGRWPVPRYVAEVVNKL